MDLQPNSTLRHWKIDKKIGDGACGQVYLAHDSRSPSSQAVALKVAKVPPVDRDAIKKKKKKSDQERAADTLYAEHLLYQNVLKGHKGIPELPLGAFGDDKGYRFLAMQLLGTDLENLVKRRGRLSSAAAAKIGLQLLDTFEFLHQKKLLFVDVKPSNFMLGLEGTPQGTQVFLVDFGLAERYITHKGDHKEFKTQTIVGTPTFLSLAAHSGESPSRKDDLEALGYVLVYLMRGDLPWEAARSNEAGLKMKKETSLEELCRHQPEEMRKFLETVRGYAFKDSPDYGALRNLLLKMAGDARPLKTEDLKGSGSGPAARKTSTVGEASMPKKVPAAARKRKLVKTAPTGPQEPEGGTAQEEPTKIAAVPQGRKAKKRAESTNIKERKQAPSRPVGTSVSQSFAGKRKEGAKHDTSSAATDLTPNSRRRRVSALAAEAKIAAQMAHKYAAIAEASAFSPPEKTRGRRESKPS